MLDKKTKEKPDPAIQQRSFCGTQPTLSLCRPSGGPPTHMSLAFGLSLAIDLHVQLLWNWLSRDSDSCGPRVVGALFIYLYNLCTAMWGLGGARQGWGGGFWGLCSVLGPMLPGEGGFRKNTYPYCTESLQSYATKDIILRSPRE